MEKKRRNLHFSDRCGVVCLLIAQSGDHVLKVTLPDRADVSAALAIRESLLRAQIGSIDAVVLDASRVVKLDVAAIQLLLAWLKVLDSQHIPWRWSGTSETFKQVVILAGLAHTLRLESGQPNEHANL